MKKQIALTILALCFAGAGFAQEIPDQLRQQPLKCGGVFFVYDYEHPVAITPAPDGYKPFYISHFARHGARYCDGEYKLLRNCLSKAARQDLLTEEGKAFHQRFGSFLKKAELRRGNLTGVGKAQHRAIAAHLKERFPEVFEGPTHVEAFSTESPRVIMSMWSCLNSLTALDEDLDLNASASAAHAEWLQPNLPSSPYYNAALFRGTPEMEKAAAEYFRKTAPCEQIAGRFFTDVDAADRIIPLQEFANALLSVITDTYCLDTDRGYFDGLLSLEESYLVWKGAAAPFALHLGRVAESGCLIADYAGFTLGEMIEGARKDIEDGKTQLRLRFGHDGGLAPLLAFMDIDGCGRPITDFGEAGAVFPSYNIPMGCSLQLVFFRNAAGDILVKPLLNEAEATLPFPAVTESYYSWEAFKAYYLPRIEEAKEKIKRAIDTK